MPVHLRSEGPAACAWSNAWPGKKLSWLFSRRMSFFSRFKWCRCLKNFLLCFEDKKEASRFSHCFAPISTCWDFPNSIVSFRVRVCVRSVSLFQMLSFQHRDGLLDCTGPFSALLLRPITQQDGLLTTKGNKLQIACGSTWRKPRDDWKEKNICFRFTGCDQTNCESEQLASHRPEPRCE